MIQAFEPSTKGKVVPVKRLSFDGLNALRGLAAISVMLFHCANIFGRNLVPNGELAVDFFFLMSGFVVAHAYSERLATRLSFSAFARLRLKRFFPLYVLGLAIGAMVIAGTFVHGSPTYPVATPALAIFLALAFLPAPPTSYSHGDLYPVNGPSWTLAVELVVNLGFAALFRWMTNRVLLAIAAVGLLLVILSTVTAGRTVGGNDWPTIWAGYARALFSFPVGVVIYRHRQRLVFDELPTWAAPVLLVAAFIVDAGKWERPFQLAFIVVVSPLVLLIGIQRVPTAARWACTALGRLSYPLYAVHLPVIALVDAVARAIHFDERLAVAVAVALLVPTCFWLDIADEKLRRGRISRRMPAPELAAP